METVRRVTTGTKEGKAVFTEDSVVEPVVASLLPGTKTQEIWHAEGELSVPDALGAPGATTYFPTSDGHAFRIVSFPPDSEANFDEDFDRKAALTEMEEKFPGMLDHFEPGAPEMHTTDSLDYGLCLS